MAEENSNATSVQPALYPEGTSPELREMIEAGVFYGRKKSKTHPEMKQYVLMNRGGIEIVDLTKTSEAIEKATGFIKEKIRQGGLALLVATQPAVEEEVLRLTKKLDIPYVTNRWAGGIITNFKIISKRIEYLKKLKHDFSVGALDKYTKKERLMIEREMNRLKELFEGLESLVRMPDVLIVINPTLHVTAVHEARLSKIPIIAFGNVDTDPKLVDYLVTGNDNAKKSVAWFLGKIEQAMEEGFAMLAKEKAKKQEAEKENKKEE